METCIGYVRVSSDKQADRGVSLETQEHKIRAMAAVLGVELSEVIVDSAESAKSLERPGMRKLLGLVESKKIRVVFIAKLDRITRSVKDLAELMDLFNRKNVSLVSVAEALDTTSPAGRLIANMMISASQWEREVIGARTKEALQYKKSKNECVGNIPYGFELATDSKHLRPNQPEQGVLCLIRHLRHSGCTLRDVASYLNGKGYKTRRGSAWRHEYVAGVMKVAH